MSYGYFCEREKKPDEKSVTYILSENNSSFEEIKNFLTKEIKSQCDYKFYGKNFGWGLMFKKSGKSLITLYPLENDFTILLIIKKEHEEKIIKIINNKKIKDKIENNEAIKEGKWVFFKWSDLKSLEKLKKVIEYKTQKNNNL